MRPPFAIDSKFPDSFVFSDPDDSPAGDAGRPSGLSLDSLLGSDSGPAEMRSAETAPQERAAQDGPDFQGGDADTEVAIVTEATAKAPVEVAKVDAPFASISAALAVPAADDADLAGAGASIIGNSGVLRKYTSGSSDGSGFNIEIVFRGFSWTQQLQQSFIDAAELLSDIIVGDVADAAVVRPIDDVKIFAKISDIDGSGGILGQAGPLYYRTADYLPINGIMEFDVADADDFDAIGMFNDIVFHEMMHVLGFGTMWDNLGLVTNAANGELHFNGANAAIAYAAEGGIGALQIETDGGPGTAGGHWDETLYGNEIMTGYIDVTGNYLSNTTIASLEDLGYDTVFDPNNPLAATSGLDMTIFNDHV